MANTAIMTKAKMLRPVCLGGRASLRRALRDSASSTTSGVITGEGVKNTIEVGVFSHCRLSLPLEAGLGPPPGVVLHRVHVAKE